MDVGSHTYCYVIDTVDPLDGISAPSPMTCLNNEPDLSFTGTYNVMGTSKSPTGPSPVVLWYVSEDGGDFQLVTAQAFISSAVDNGQRPGTRGGWPNSLPVNNPSIEKNEDFFSTIASTVDGTVLLTDPVPTALVQATVTHDDTMAAQAAMHDALANGGGTVQFDKGNYSIRRPVFSTSQVNSYGQPIFSRNLSDDPWYAGYAYLVAENGYSGPLNIQGLGSATQITTTPDHNSATALFEVGLMKRPNDLTQGLFSIENVDPGATQVTITGSDGSTLKTGDDVFLYSGSFTATPCLNSGLSAGECHFSEINAVSAIEGSTVTLKYPASKKFFDDGSSVYGMVKALKVTHGFGLQSMTINTFSPVTSTGMVDGMLISSIQINGSVSHGPFGGGFKRNVTIQTSSWSFGAGDASYNATDEYDQCTNYLFSQNAITGTAALGAEGPSLMARIYATEGSSQFAIMNNVFTNASFYSDQSTDDVVRNNTFVNGTIQIGTSYNASYDSGPTDNPSYTSFGSQNTADVEGNSFISDAQHVPPFLLRVGKYQSSTISNNTLSYSGPHPTPLLVASGGTLTDNTVTVNGAKGSIGIALVPDASSGDPAAPFNLYGNSIQGASAAAGIYVPNPGFTDAAPICIQATTFSLTGGTNVLVGDAQTVDLACPQSSLAVGNQ